MLNIKTKIYHGAGGAGKANIPTCNVVMEGFFVEYGTYLVDTKEHGPGVAITLASNEKEDNKTNEIEIHFLKDDTDEIKDPITITYAKKIEHFRLLMEYIKRVENKINIEPLLLAKSIAFNYPSDKIKELQKQIDLQYHVTHGSPLKNL